MDRERIAENITREIVAGPRTQAEKEWWDLSRDIELWWTITVPIENFEDNDFTDEKKEVLWRIEHEVRDVRRTFKGLGLKELSWFEKEDNDGNVKLTYRLNLEKYKMKGNMDVDEVKGLIKKMKFMGPMR